MDKIFNMVKVFYGERVSRVVYEEVARADRGDGGWK
jgi:hypothetical protein